MTVVLVHIGCTSGPFVTTFRPPEWLWHCVQQYFTFNDDPVYILTDRENIPHLPKHDKVIPAALEDYHSNKIGRFHAVYEHGIRDFWTVAATRFMYLEAFLRDNDLRHVYHFDNDVLIYFNIAEHHDVFRRLYPGLAITPESSQRASALFMYINDSQALAGLTDFFIEMLEQHGELRLGEMHDTNVVTEMLLIASYMKTYDDRMACLPILPSGEQSLGIDELGAIFDPGSWGEAVDGTRQGKSVGHHAPGAYVVQWLKENLGSVIWETENGLWCPYLKWEGGLTKINSLHMHSKNLIDFTSEGNLMAGYWAKLNHNYHELTATEKLRYEQRDCAGLSTREKFFYEGCIPIPGEMYKAERKALYDAILRHRPILCFEIGTGSGGGSTFFLACAFAKLGQGKVVTMEVADNTALYNYQQFLPGLLPFVEFLKGSDPALFMPFIEDNGGVVDCIFLDGADDSEEAVAQYEFFKPFFRPGLILMAHDWDTEKMRLLRPIIEADPGWSIEVRLDEPESVGFIVAKHN